MTPIEPGRLLKDRYRLTRRLGEGGMGSVWSAEHIELRSKVAIKLIVPHHTGDPTILARFEREARAAAALRGPHVVQILDYGVDDGRAFIVMEELAGEDLQERLEREKRLSPALTATVITHVARAIGRAHEAELVHRDLKPSNVFLVQNDDEIVAKVLDFGIAKFTSPPDDLHGASTDTGTMLGSPFYMSPEQARGRSDVDWRADLWSLGVVAFECLVGRRPFDGTSLGDLVMAICHDPLPVPSSLAGVPAGFDAWFARATQRDPGRRFQSAKELAVELRAVLTPNAIRLSDPAEDSGSRPEVTRPPAAIEETTLPPRSGLLEPRASEKPLGVTTTGGTSGSRSPAAQSAASDRRRWGWTGVGLGLVVVVALGISLWGASSDPEPSRTAVDRAPAKQEPSAVMLEPAPSVLAPSGVPLSVVSAPASAIASASPTAPRASARPKAKPSAPASTPAPNLLDKRF